MAYTTINKPSQYFNTVLYTGNDATNRSITGVGFQPDWTWIKSRSDAYYHELYDVVRGFSSTTNGRVLYSNTTGAEGTPNTFNSFNTDGFTVSKQSGETGTNGNGSTFVAWNWLANNTSGSSNTQGTITSTVSVNQTAGFSIVSYTGTGSNATVGHGLGVAPAMIILKNRTSGVEQWHVLHKSLNTTGGQYLLLSATNTVLTNSVVWNSTAPTSSVFSIGTAGGVNGSGNNLIAYCFAEVKGYSKFGSYTGNGSADGTFVYTGFKPALVVIKNTTHANNWIMLDNKRGPYNLQSTTLYPNTNDAETSTTTNFGMDFLSNGIKMRTSGDYNTNSNNSSGDIYIYMAFAENPFVSSTLIPTTAR